MIRIMAIQVRLKSLHRGAGGGGVRQMVQHCGVDKIHASTRG